MTMKRATRRKLFALGVVLVAALGVAGLYRLREASKARALMQDRAEGLAAYERRDYSEAIPRLSRYVGAHHEDAEALLAFADARRLVPAEDGSASHLKHALATTRVALEHDPDSLKGRTMLMELNAQLGLATETDRAAQAVLELDPTNRAAYGFRLDVARSTGDDKTRIQVATAMAEHLPRDYGAQADALATVIDAGMPGPDVEAFVAEHKAGLRGTMGGELLDAMYALHRQNAARSDAELATLRAQVADHIAAAAALPPTQAVEVSTLLNVLDTNPRLLPDRSPEDLLRGYLADPALGAQLTDFAAQRGWQRGDRDLLQAIADRPESPGTLSDDALGWLALGLPERTALADALRARPTEPAKQWATVLAADAAIREGRVADARDGLKPITAATQGAAAQVARYLDAKCLYSLGESGLAEQEANALAGNPTWVRARVLLRDQALISGDYERALSLMMRDRLPGAALLLLDAAVSLDETGYQWPPGQPDGLAMVDRSLASLPDNPELLALKARAVLARGDTAQADALADKLLGLEQPAPSPLVAKLADRLAGVDAARADALRARFAPAAASLTQRLSTELLAGAIDPRDARAQLEDALKSAPPEQQRDLRLLRAGVLEQLGAPEAAEAFTSLSADYPKDADIQTAALRSDALWRDPEAARPVIQRLHALTGDDGLAWRVFDARLSLQQDQSEATAARVLVDLASVLRLAPEDALALTLSAEAATRVNDLSRAAGYATRASDASPSSLELAIRAVNALERAGLTDEARSRVHALAAIPAPTVGDRVARAALLGRFGEAASALADWRELAKSSNPDARAGAARALASLGATDDAAAAIAGLADLDGATVNSREATADALMTLGRRDEAVALLKAAPEFEAPGEDRDAAIANLLARHADGAEALAELTGFVKTSRSAEAWAAALRRHMGEGSLDEARALLAEALGVVDDPTALASFRSALDPDAESDDRSYLAVARAAIGSQNPAWGPDLVGTLDAVIRGDTTLSAFADQMQTFVAANRGVSMGWLLLVQTQVTLGEWSSARRAIRDMLNAFPGDAQTAAFAVRMYSRMLGSAPGSMAQALIAEALPIARDAEARLPEPTLESSRAVAAFAMDAGLTREAWSEISPWRSQLSTPSDISLYAQAALANAQLDAAGELWWRSSLAEPDRTRAAIRMAAQIPDASARARWLTEAATRLTEGDDAGRFELANGWYQLALAGGGADALGKALAAAGGPEAGDPQLRASLTLLRASCLSQLGRDDEAIGAYRTVLGLTPDNATACNNLAYILLGREGQTEEALTLARHAVELARAAGSPKDVLASYLDTLGTALLRAGRTEDARKAYEESLGAQPGYDYALVGLAEACAALGDADKARAALRDLGTGVPKDLAARVAKVREQLDK